MADNKERPVDGDAAPIDGPATSAGYRGALAGGASKRLPVDARELRGWDAYRRWLDRVDAPATRRSGANPALYTWKGYRSWAEKVRRDWKPEE
ncbi:MAG: hypothetical protein JJT85_04425 [Chromatiales bacterium]|nr:hypothetical protein [Chromatiales bacterium]